MVEWLVEQQEVSAGEGQQGQGEPCPLAVREIASASMHRIAAEEVPVEERSSLGLREGSYRAGLVQHGAVEVNRFLLLSESSRNDTGAEPDAASTRGQLPRQESDQRGLATSVGSGESDPLTEPHMEVDILKDPATAQFHVGSFDDGDIAAALGSLAKVQRQTPASLRLVYHLLARELLL